MTRTWISVPLICCLTATESALTIDAKKAQIKTARTEFHLGKTGPATFTISIK